MTITGTESKFQGACLKTFFLISLPNTNGGESISTYGCLYLSFFFFFLNGHSWHSNIKWLYQMLTKVL